MDGSFHLPVLDDGSLGRQLLSSGGLFCRYLGLGVQTDNPAPSAWLAASPDFPSPVPKPPLVILHGLFGSGANWLSHAGVPAGQRPVLLFDLDGHDGSRDRGAASYRGMVESLILSLDLASRAGFPGLKRPFHLLGHSMGGKIAMLLALEKPSMLASIVIADIAPKSYPPHHPGILDLLVQARPETWQDRRQAQAGIARFVDDPGEQAFMVWNLKPRADGGFEWKFDAPGLIARYPEIVSWPGSPEVSCPVPGLFLTGGKSRYVEDTDVPGILGLFPGASFVTLPDAGHWIHVDQKASFLRHTNEYLFRMDQ